MELISSITANIFLIGIYSSKISSNIKTINILALIVLVPLIWFLFNKVISIKYVSDYFENYRGIIFSNWLQSVLLFVVTWLLYGMSLQLVSQFLTEGNRLLFTGSTLLFTIIYCIAWLIGFLVFFVPAGLGIREFALTMLLSDELNLPIYQASGIAILLRLITSLVELAWLVIGIALKSFSAIKE